MRTLNAYWTGFPPVCPNADEYSHADKQMHAWNERAGKTLEEIEIQGRAQGIHKSLQLSGIH